MVDIDFTVVKTLFKSPKGLKIGEIKRILDMDSNLKHMEVFYEKNIPHSTLGSCIKRLNDKGYVDYKPYHEVHLTKQGAELAKELNRHSRLLEVLLYNELNLSPEIAHYESEKFSLLFSCETINKICEKYDHPKACPCGEQILSSTVCTCSEKH